MPFKENKVSMLPAEMKCSLPSSVNAWCTHTHIEHMTKATGLLHIHKLVGTVDGSTEYFLMQIYLLVVMTDEEEGTCRDIRSARKSSKHMYPLNLSSFCFSLSAFKTECFSGRQLQT